ncbi:gliding motility-associated C-terminal domain-containing protein [candidate division WOR-3 bacterium]|nr:gliding motility-associated C-terminal domain-containing protein [candidate division WOR-3 bacterium]
MANPKGNETGQGSPGDRNEFVEFYNAATNSVDLSKYLLSDGDAIDIIMPWTDERLIAQNVIYGTCILEPGHYAVILDPEYTEPGDFYQPYSFGDNTLIVTVDNTTIGNGLSVNDPVLLKDSLQNVISTYGTPWDSLDGVPFDPGDGISAERINPSAEDSENSWMPSLDYCTPGMENSVYCSGLWIDPISLHFTETYPSLPCTISIFFKNMGQDTLEDFRISLLYTDYLNLADSLKKAGETIYDKSLFPGLSDSASIIWENPPAGLFTFFVKALEASVSRMIRFGNMPGQIILSEIMFAPYLSKEWFELKNRYTEKCSLDFLYVSGNDSAPVSLALDPLCFAVICEDSSEFLSSYINFTGTLFQPKTWPIMNNSADSIKILGLCGTQIDAFSYVFSSWENGYSLERVCDDVPSDVSGNWSRCVSPEGGTPGAINSVGAVLPQFSGSLSVSPNPFSPDGDGIDETCVLAVSLGSYPEIMKIKIYDVTGHLVRTFESVEHQMIQYFIWDGREESGKKLDPGIYIILLSAKTADGKSYSIKTTVVLAEKL